MDAFVLDVSACLPWCCEDETTAASEETLEWAQDGRVLHVPSLWIWEILNAVSVVIKRKRISADRGEDFLVQLATLNLKVDPPPQVSDLSRLHMLAAAHLLTAYDAAYLDLATRLSHPLATKDTELRKAAQAVGIQLL
jgi:predicted nucleic acid-binding protein